MNMKISERAFLEEKNSMKTAFFFAGQGAQYIGMGKDLYENIPDVKRFLIREKYTKF